MVKYDVVIIGAGASGMFAAASAINNGRNVAIIEMGATSARKVAVSGGGNCNLTNTNATYLNYFGANPEFARSALSQFSPQDMIVWAQNHNIRLYEKTPGRYFCVDGAKAVVDALIYDTKTADVFFNTVVEDIDKVDNIFCIKTNKETFQTNSVIVASGGISFPALGVSDIGYKIAKKFGHSIVPVRPALCMIKIKDNPYSDFSGISVPAEICVGKNKIYDDLLFTHMGIGGPAAYRASLYDLDNGITINMLPKTNLMSILIDIKRSNGRKQISTVLSEYMPSRIAKFIAQNDTRNIADIKNTDLEQIVTNISKIYIPGDKIKLHSMASAEVVRGGISTKDISSKTMESKLCAGLYFTGEVLDITGDLGGFNLQWAWASGFVAGKNA